MTKCSKYIFSLVINSLTFDWEPKHVIIRVFEARNVARISLAMQICVLGKYNCFEKIICHVKYGGGNLTTMNQALTYVMNCQGLGLFTIWWCLFWPCLKQGLPINHNWLCKGFLSVIFECCKIYDLEMYHLAQNFEECNNELHCACVDSRI
jgi:hypothetical protein